MGCGGSKSEVASGNTIAARLLRRKSSSTASSAAAASTDEKKTGGGSVADVNDALTASDKVADVSAAAAAVAAEVGNLPVSRHSSDRYFSSRKDSVDTDVAGGYHTPLVELLVPPPEAPATKETDAGEPRKDDVAGDAMGEAVLDKVAADHEPKKQAVLTANQTIGGGDASSKPSALPVEQVPADESKAASVDEGKGDLEDGKVPIDSTRKA